MTIQDIIKEHHLTISNGDKWLSFENDNWIIKQLKAKTTREQYLKQGGPIILYSGKR